MKRNIKGIISLLLAVVMLFGCGTTAMAATVGKTLKLGVYQSLTAKEAIDENNNYIAQKIVIPCEGTLSVSAYVVGEEGSTYQGFALFKKADMSDESLIKSFDGGLTEKAKTVIKVNVKKGNIYFKEAVPEENYKFKLSFTPAKRNISSLKNVASKKMTVKWGKLTGASGYQMQYSKAKSFSSKKTVTIKGDATVSKTVTKLTKGKTYYVRVRTYKNINGKAVYSGWSTVKSIKIKK